MARRPVSYAVVWAGRGAMPHEQADGDWFEARRLPSARYSLQPYAPGNVDLTARDCVAIERATSHMATYKPSRVCGCGRRLAMRWTKPQCSLCLRAGQQGGRRTCGCGRLIRKHSSHTRCVACRQRGVTLRRRAS